MEKIGNKIRKYRLEKNMTQSQLADGICTQATISNLENNSSLPSIANLLLIAERLSIKHTDLYEAILVNSSGYIDTFNKVKSLQREDNYIEANQLLKNAIDYSDLASIYEKKEYFYYFGVSSLRGLHDFSDAHYHFNQCLALSEVDDLKTLDLLATMGIAEAYDMCHQFDKADTYFIKAINQLEQVSSWKKSTHDRLDILEAYKKAATFYLKIAQYSLALSLSAAGINFYATENINQGLEDLLDIKEQSLFYLGDVELAEEYYFYAMALAKLNKNDKQIQLLREQIIKHGLKQYDYLNN